MTTTIPRTPGSRRPARNESADLLALLAEQKAAILQLQELGREQRRLIDAGEADGLLRLLQRRQTMIDGLRRLSDRITPLKDDLTRIVDEATERDAAEIRTMLDQVQTLFAALVQQDEDDKNALQAARDDTARQLRQSSSAGRAMAAYGPKRIPNAYTDRQG